MNLRYFIDRPVLSAVISVLLIMMGVIGLTLLPIEQYPDIAPPTIQVYTSYPGANAETVLKSVIVPLEESINGVEDMTYITSSASNNGDATINVYFKQGANADMAAVNVQNRVSTAQSLLPSEVTKIGVTTMKQQNAELKTFSLYSPEGKYDQQFLNNYMKLRIEPRLKRIQGVGNVTQYGSNYSMRIWMKPEKMAQYKLIPSDITAVLASQNIEAATGAFGENHDNAYQYTMKYRGRKSTPEEFGNLVVRSLPGGDVLRLKEVADIELGDEAYNYSSNLNGKPAATATIYQTAGSNASEIINKIDDLFTELSMDLPEGIELVTLSDTNHFLYASIHEVVKTLVEAIFLVVLIVFVFLQNFRSTLIPTVGILVSIIGTFAFMSLAGFSINQLTLFALVLAIGTVVDDAIIVVEAVQARFDAGYYSSYMATNDAMRGVSSAILTSTLIFMAVFIPVSLMGGTSGEFYRQFGITMAVAVGISAINAFTLSPALCALLLRPNNGNEGEGNMDFANRFRTAFNASFDAMNRRYVKGVVFMIKRYKWAWGIIALAFVALAFLVSNTKTGLIPDEDTGTVMVSLNTKPGTSLEETKRQVKRLTDSISTFPEVNYCADIIGYSFSGSGPSMAMVIASLHHWDERKGEGHSAQDIVGRIYGIASNFPELQMFVMTPPMIPGYGMGGGFELYLQDETAGDITKFKQAADKFVEALNNRPEIESAYSAFDVSYPQYWVDIDAAKCQQAGITTSEILETLSGYYGGGYVSNFNRFSKLYRVMIQAAPGDRITPESMNHIYVRINGEMAPLSQFVRLIKTYGPQEMSRFNLYNSIAVNGTPAHGYSSGDALKAIKETAEQVLPKSYSYEFGGISREESQTMGNTVVIFAICLVLVYLILCALYESVLVPFAIVLSVPCGLLGSFLFAQALGLENNVYMQTGIIMLIGLLAKTAILLTEYATKRREAGMTLVQSAYTAARIRLRPILMTVLAMVFGMIPLMLSHGVGANGNRSLASGVVGGIIVGTLALLFLVPVLFVGFRYLHEKMFHTQPFRLEEDAEINAELEDLKK